MDTHNHDQQSNSDDLPNVTDQRDADRLDRGDSIQDESSLLVSSPTDFVDLPNDTLESALDRLLRSILRNYSGPHLEALRARLGWNGDDPITLQKAGRQANITRERVRQIESRVKREAKNRVPRIVNQLLDFLPKLRPVLWSSLSNQLVESGITGKQWSGRATKAVLDHCGFPHWKFVEGARDSLVGPAEYPILNRLGETVSIARRTSRASGAISLEYLANILPFPVPMSILRDMLQCAKDIEFITPDYCWVPRTPAKRVRIQNVSKKMLSLNRPLSIGDIRRGLERKFSFRNKTGSAKYEGVVPPNEVLIALFKMYPDFRVINNEQIDYIGELKPENELTRPELAIVRAFEHMETNALDRQTIKEFGDDRGINMSSLEVEMTYSPIVVQIRQNVWRLVGSSVSDAVVEQVQSRIRSKGFQRRLIDKGKLPNGDFRIVFRLPRFVHNFVASVPSEIGGMKLDAIFRTHEGVTLRCKNGAIFGFGKFLTKSDCSEGNFLTIDLNLEDRTFNWSVSLFQPGKIQRAY
ncbi:MAG: hypothetical protein OXG24_06785 [Gammaproteobacteria bacterium]|nr:hypothetical protein [Gammaproteobacteria bacterium]